MKNILFNQKGGMAALLSVLILSGIAVTTLTSAYVYLENRAKYNGRIIASYQTAYGMEDIAVNLRQIYDSSIAAGATVVDANGNVTGIDPTRCPANAPARPFSNNTMRLCIPDTMFEATTANAFGCMVGPCLCVNTSSGIGRDGRYCASLADNPQGAAQLEQEREMIAQSPVKKWLAKMDVFFDTTIDRSRPELKDKMYAFLDQQIKPPTVLGWMLPQKALAYIESPTLQQDRGYESPVGSHTNPNYQAGGYYNRQSDMPGSKGKENQPDKTGSIGDDRGDLGNIETCTGPDCGHTQLPSGAFRLSSENCVYSEGILVTGDPTRCETCRGIQCTQLAVRSVMCANLPQGAQCPYGVGRMNIKFE